MSEGRAIKRHGIISCDACGRDFDTGGVEWCCEHCGFDNAVAMRERYSHMMRKGSERASANRAAERAAAFVSPS